MALSREQRVSVRRGARCVSAGRPPGHVGSEGGKPPPGAGLDAQRPAMRVSERGTDVHQERTSLGQQDALAPLSKSTDLAS